MWGEGWGLWTGPYLYCRVALFLFVVRFWTERDGLGIAYRTLTATRMLSVIVAALGLVVVSGVRLGEDCGTCGWNDCPCDHGTCVAIGGGGPFGGAPDFKCMPNELGASCRANLDCESNNCYKGKCVRAGCKRHGQPCSQASCKENRGITSIGDTMHCSDCCVTGMDIYFHSGGRSKTRKTCNPSSKCEDEGSSYRVDSWWAHPAS